MLLAASCFVVRRECWFGSNAAAMVVAVVCAGPSCYATQGLPAADLGPLRQTGRSREVLLSSGQQGKVRIRPSSLVRFHRVDGAATSWTEATNVRFTPELIVVDRGRAGPQVIAWTEVDEIEVNDLDLGRTALGVVGGSTLILVSLVTEALILGALAAVHVRLDEVGLTRATADALVSSAGRHLDEDASEAQVLPEESPAPPELVAGARSLFSSEARRRDLVRASLAVDSGVELGSGQLRSRVGAMGSLRVLNILELGAGIGLVGAGPPGAGSLTDPDGPLGQQLQVSGRGRIGLHLDLDAARRVGLFLGQEVGWSTEGAIDARTIWGVRLRVLDRWQVGLLPFNPRVTWPGPNALSLTAYASSLELAWIL